MSKYGSLRIMFLAVVFGVVTGAASATTSANESATGLSNLPASAQGPISAALGKGYAAYWFLPHADVLKGGNPRHALVMEFSNHGADFNSHRLHWGLQTSRYGYGDVLDPVEPVAPHADSNRVEYRRDGITEWYVNGPLGLEQGFTLLRAPGKTNGQPLTLELTLRGDLLAAIGPGGKDLELRQSNGRVTLRYSGLSARDGTGRELHSWIELRGQRLLLRVEDKGAQYPLIVDPWVQQAELTASDGAVQDGFASSIAVYGTTIVVGAPCHPYSSGNCGPGAAYVFVQSGTTWSQQAELKASDGAARDEFGTSVAIYGTTIVVGAYLHLVSGFTYGPGAAYVFVQSGTSWTQQAELTPSDGYQQDEFGFSVAIYGTNRVVVGAPCHPRTASCGPGAAYVFAGSNGKWSQQTELAARGGVVGDEFGYSVSVSGTTAVVGAPTHEDGSNQSQGAAYVFLDTSGIWAQQAVLTSSDGAASDDFGISVSINSNTVISGAPNHKVGSNTDQGAAYVFVRSGTTWTQQAELTSSDGAAYDWFGLSVGVNGSNKAVVGAPEHTVGSNYFEGTAYGFVRSGTTWSQTAEMTGSDSTTRDSFGGSVSINGTSTVVGAPGHPDQSNQGSAYVFVN